MEDTLGSRVIGSMPAKEIRNCGTYVSSSSSDFYEVDVTKPLRPIRCKLLTL